MRVDLGISLLILGAGVTAIGYLILNSIPVFIMGISILIMGILATWGEDSLGGVNQELMSTAWENVAALIESVGIVNKAVYLPSSLTQDSRAYALITPAQPTGLTNIPTGLIVKYGPSPNEVGILVRTMGTRAVELCRESGAISTDLESSLNNCIVNHLGLARRVISHVDGDRVRVVINGSRAVNAYGNTVVRAVLGSPMASIVASVVAESLNRPVIYDSEGSRGGEYWVEVTLLGT
ncbi:hypothetical protein [Vulcanisaeta thermophila]|uniref:hypothetical protein n=1 Tax=Vulcanisaeta thermophila TaxID=867917 RepID=UPI000852B423|nr:hypothetical protein [Vulcanisaeta thermophila]